jgi:hypothetical protein
MIHLARTLPGVRHPVVFRMRPRRLILLLLNLQPENR